MKITWPRILAVVGLVGAINLWMSRRLYIIFNTEMD